MVVQINDDFNLINLLEVLFDIYVKGKERKVNIILREFITIPTSLA